MNEKRKFAASFFVGVLAGALAAGAGLHYYRHCRMDRDVDPQKREQLHQQRIEKFAKKLQLTPGQRTQAERIFKEKHQKMMALREQTEPKMKEIREAAAAEIRALLTPEQHPKFDEMMKRWEKRRPKF